MLKLYDYLDSGNGYKIRLLLRQLQLPFEYVEKDILRGETRTPEFLARNPNGRIPVLELDDGSFIFESNAILWYLAEDTRFAPRSRRARAETLQWMFFEQYSHEPYVATPRFIVRHLAADHPRRQDLPRLLETGRAALAVMERHLKSRTFFVDERYGIADIALYAYTHVAEQGGHVLAPYPAVRAWLARVAAEPDYLALDAQP
ncbi:MAG TPA: glutathione S-transferase family protein [Steroidobacteraceae bacterium]|nr:glutathione S-transferase family protein [Steroidobacteraceae bacterium]